MRSRRDDGPTVDDEDEVGFPERGEAVGDGKGRSPLHQPVERRLNLHFGNRIEIRGRLVTRP